MLVTYIPFGSCAVQTADVSAVGTAIKGQLLPTENTGGPVLVATLASACLLWTSAWATCLQRVVDKAAYRADLRKRILASRVAGVQLANTFIQLCTSRSVLAVPPARARKKAGELVASARRISKAAPLAWDQIAQGDWDSAAKTIAVPGLPPGGYTFKFLPILLFFLQR